MDGKQYQSQSCQHERSKKKRKKKEASQATRTIH